MRSSTLLPFLLSTLVLPSFCQDAICASPMVQPLMMLDGKVLSVPDDQPLADVMGCCVDHDSILTPRRIGKMPQMTEQQALQILEAAKQAYKGGAGIWPQTALSERRQAIHAFLRHLQTQREEIIQVLMWEIGKNQVDATAEFDRTVQFIETMMDEMQHDPEFNSEWQTVGSTRAHVRRAALGVVLILGPYNYPLNETWAMVFAALLTGNIVILKIPTVGGLCHLLTMDAFAKALPPGTIHFISGSGRATMPPLMKTGAIDALGFIGGSKAADQLIKQHPHPHRLKLFLQLEAKNMAIFLPDLFQKGNSALLDSTIGEAITGSLSYNGQRCTALKILFVPQQHANTFVTKFVGRVQAMTIGLPWATFEDGNVSQLTPLPNQKRVAYMKELIDDAISKGAAIVNKDGSSIIGGDESTLMVPAVLYPVTKDMKVYYEEQFGPVIPIVPYEDVSEILQYAHDGDYGQQASIFTSQQDAPTAATILDQFSAVFGKININSQCGRSPDTLPFSGRRSSAMGIMSARYAVREFSVPTVVAYKDKDSTANIVGDIQKESIFLKSL